MKRCNSLKYTTITHSTSKEKNFELILIDAKQLIKQVISDFKNTVNYKTLKF